MSARRINRMTRLQQSQGGGHLMPAPGHVQGPYQGPIQGPFIHGGRQDVVTRKREERMVREAFRRDKKVMSYLADDENYPSFKNQLAKVGLELRDIPGDGNCLFRALGDQYEGHVRNHFRHRQDVVKYMTEHPTDFEPFLAEDTTFDKHVSHLRSMGTYAGNDAIVAFARLHQVSIIIHQLNSPFLLIQGSNTPTTTTKQLHIAYHNGDHYSSVRRVDDNTESPTSIRLKVTSESVEPGQTQMNGYAGVEDGMVRAIRDTRRLAEEVMNATGCMDEEQVLASLADCDYDVDATIAYVLQIMDTCTQTNTQEDTTSLASQVTSTDSGVWSENGTKQYQAVDFNHNGYEVKGHYRDNSYGGSSGYGSVSSQNGGARPKLSSLMAPAAVPKQIPEKMTGKQKKLNKKLEKKKKAEDRHRQRIIGAQPPRVDDDDGDHRVVTVISKELQMTHI